MHIHFWTSAVCFSYWPNHRASKLLHFCEDVQAAQKLGIVAHQAAVRFVFEKSYASNALRLMKVVTICYDNECWILIGIGISPNFLLIRTTTRIIIHINYHMWIGFLYSIPFFVSCWGPLRLKRTCPWGNNLKHASKRWSAPNTPCSSKQWSYHNKVGSSHYTSILVQNFYHHLITSHSLPQLTPIFKLAFRPSTPLVAHQNPPKGSLAWQVSSLDGVTWKDFSAGLKTWRTQRWFGKTTWLMEGMDQSEKNNNKKRQMEMSQIETFFLK